MHTCVEISQNLADWNAHTHIRILGAYPILDNRKNKVCVFVQIVLATSAQRVTKRLGQA